MHYLDYWDLCAKDPNGLIDLALTENNIGRLCTIAEMVGHTTTLNTKVCLLALLQHSSSLVREHALLGARVYLKGKAWDRAQLIEAVLKMMYNDPVKNVQNAAKQAFVMTFVF